MRQSECIADLAAALAKAQAKIEGAVKDKSNPAFRSKYADLGACWDAIREPLSSNGLSIVQFPRTVDGAVEVETILMHASGQYIADIFAIPVSKRDAHGYMSAATYARRGSLMAVAGIAPVDDDGNLAAGRPATGAMSADPIHEAKREIEAQNGPQPSQYQVDKARRNGTAAKAADPAKKAEQWATDAIADLSKVTHVEAISQFWRENEKALTKLRTEYSDEYERICVVADELRDRLPSITQAA